MRLSCLACIQMNMRCDSVAGAGFKDVRTESRNAWYREEARRELNRLRTDLYDEAVRQSMYTPAEWNAIGMLLDPYYNCKIGKLSRQDTIATQNEVQRVYEQDILRSKICPSRTA